MLRKVFFIFVIAILIIGASTNVRAVELKTSLNVIQPLGEIKYFENDQGYISKNIVDSNKETGEVTVELKVVNLPKDNTETTYENTEVLIMIPEDLRAEENLKENTEKFSQYISYIENLATKIFANNSKIKIGIIGIQGPIDDAYENDEGKFVEGPKNEGSKPGSEEDSEIVVNLTNDINTIKTGLQNMNKDGVGYYNNLEAAIKLSANSFSKNANKILISLYDNVPESAIGECSYITYGGATTIEDAVIEKNSNIVEYTKKEILNLKESDIDFILLKPEDTSFDQKWYNKSTGELELDFDGSEYVKDLYGTIQEPTYGKMYSLDEVSLEKIITENIYGDIIDKIRLPISSIKVVDYFPNEIVENFDFEYGGNPTIGTTTDKIDNNTITWNIETLNAQETAILKYKLKIKDMKNTDLLNKTIPTNEKLVLTYKDIEAKDYTINITNSPKVQLAEIKEEWIVTVSHNPTTNTTENVTVAIKTSRKVNEVEGWTLSDDEMALTKVYSINAAEIVQLVDKDGNTKDVKVQIDNIILPSEPEDPTIAEGTIPNAGLNMLIAYSLIAIIVISIITYKKYNNYKDLF